MATQDIVIRKGSTFSDTVYYAQPVLTVKPLTAITKSGQAVVTAAAHGLAIDWWAWVVGVVGMDQVNHRADELKNLSKAYRAYYVDSDTLRLDLDTTRFNAYTSGGELLYFPPVDLSTYTARMQIRDPDADGAIAVSLTSGSGLTLTANGEIKRVIDAVTTAALDFDLGVYDLELVDPFGVVIPVVSGRVTTEAEVTK
jgi:hypothetical protein